MSLIFYHNYSRETYNFYSTKLSKVILAINLPSGTREYTTEHAKYCLHFCANKQLKKLHINIL